MRFEKSFACTKTKRIRCSNLGAQQLGVISICGSGLSGGLAIRMNQTGFFARPLSDQKLDWVDYIPR